jgi:alkylation response protein AidB-like acyl-CoA dehydrogenase
MDFGFSPAQSELYERMRALGGRVEAAPEGDRMRLLAEGGALGLPLPRDLGGEGWDLVSTARAYEGLGMSLRDGGLLLAAGAHLFGVALAVARVGSPAQQRRLLPELAAGRIIGTVAATEAGSGSDIASVSGVVERGAGGGFRVRGEKRYVTWADRAGLFLFVGRDGAGARGLSTLLVPARAPGIRVGERLSTAGLPGARLAPVVFEDVPVDDDALLGRAGAGLAVFQIAMTYERALILAFRLGAMERALDEAVRFCRARAVGDVPIARHQAVAGRIARMKLRLSTSRLLVYQAAWSLDQGQRAQAEAALAKWHLGESAVESALDDIALRGGAGYLEGSGLPGALDDALGGTIHSGTSDVLSMLVARWMGV